MATVLHVLPHRGGGAETHLDLLEAAGGPRHVRRALSDGRTPAEALRSLPRRYGALVRGVRRADLVHVHGDMAAVLSLPLQRPGPAVWTTHGLHALRRMEGPAGALVRAGLRAACARCAATICTSAAERDELRAQLRPALHDRLTVVHNGVPIRPPATAEERAAARRAHGLGDELVVLFLGELHPRKGPALAVEAVGAARRDGADAVLLVAGEGPLLGTLRAEAGEHVRVLGRSDDPAGLLAAADVLVMPSEREGLSMAVLEAMERGLVCVVSDGPGNPEAVGEAGIVVSREDAAALAGALHALGTDPARRRALAAAARERAERSFSAERFVEETLAVYRAAGVGAADRRRG